MDDEKVAANNNEGRRQGDTYLHYPRAIARQVCNELQDIFERDNMGDGEIKLGLFGGWCLTDGLDSFPCTLCGQTC
ncbi:hypothetical protein G5I_08444 [Acromyrmex echinatior]|uniref:Uncharacterized protein n=1 Tax=Acromyrmex echinatior TaxID=103372 RepID=F4WRJ3_ACREC|nr:hypothetical protein G5I_08444 [Acromyrmex echinatior]